jgi:hypothetical protein
MGWFSKRTPVQEFWRWFVKNEPRLRAADVRDARTGSEIGAHLKAVHPSLTWEWGDSGNGKRDLILSAEGIREAAASVEAIADAAPPLPRWRIIRFRPRWPDYDKCTLEYGGARFEPHTIECALARDGSLIGVTLLMPQLASVNENAWKGAAFLLLDTALGEYDVMMRVGFIEVLPMDADVPVDARFPFTQLRDQFDRLAEDMLTGGKD